MKLKIGQWALVGFLAVGNMIAWSTVALGYQAFFRAGGHMFQFSGCSVTNPLATPCLYGAIAFLIAIIWTAKKILKPVNLPRSFRNLSWFLLASSLFGWGNVIWEIKSMSVKGSIQACGAKTVTNIFQSSCLYGTMAFTLALLCAFIIYRQTKSKSEPDQI